mmetsp:Transcript_14621/g.31327  ORF Transcript_14621/g.31327 Transcript_14621/m.31327 type:complete len:413 (+) Transcript_14621:2-1240(+)
MKLGTALSRPSRALTLTLAFAARSVRTTRITATRESTLFASRALRTARSITNVQMAHTDSTEVKKQKTGAFTSLESHSKNGAFERKESMHHFSVSSEPGAKYPAVAGRYHLYISYACPWANRVLAVRNLKGLQDVISVSAVHPTWQKTKPDDPSDPHWGWVFHPNGKPVSNKAGHGSLIADEACDPDHVNALPNIRAIYEHAGSDETKFTVPVLFDKETGTIVNNESSELVRMLNTEFNALAKNPSLDLYPEALRPAIDEVNSWVYPTINNGVYRCGFAKTQEAYDEAFEQLFSSLARVENILSKQRYIASTDAITEADVRLFMTLVRFDEVYVVYFKTNGRMLSQYENIHNYLRELYQIPEIASSINMAHIKQHYFTSHAELNTYAIIPKGPGVIEDLKLPHDRAQRFKSA